MEYEGETIMVSMTEYSLEEEGQTIMVRMDTPCSMKEKL